MNAIFDRTGAAPVLMALALALIIAYTQRLS